MKRIAANRNLSNSGTVRGVSGGRGGGGRGQGGGYDVPYIRRDGILN